MAEAELAPLSPAELDSVQSLVQNTLASASSHLANDFDDPATFLRLPSHLHAVEQLLSDYTVLENLIPNELYRTTLHRIDETLELLLDRERAGPDPVFPLRPPVYRTAAGRTALAVERDVMVGLAADGLTNAEMALVLGVSLSTVKRRRKKYGLGREHTPPTQEEVDRIVKEVVEDGNQAVGEVLLLGMLRARGQGHLPRKMVRETLRGLDRQRVVDRWMKAIKRRRYSVPFPNSLWHIDGHHKLIRWRIVTHGGVDGKTRLAVYLQASGNNEAATVRQAFIKATEVWGWPSRVRADYGGENLQVKVVMEYVRGEGRGSFIPGRSVHNQRIERLWRDMHRAKTSLFKALFEELESEVDAEGRSLLDHTSAVDLWCLHYVFLPLLNRALLDFCEQWNRHRLRTLG